jgi:hypothetical protein
MGFTTNKYQVSVSFCCKQAFLVKLKANHFRFCAKIYFFKTRKNLYMGPLYVTDPEYCIYDQEIYSFDQFLPQTHVFR